MALDLTVKLGARRYEAYMRLLLASAAPQAKPHR